MSEQKTDRRTRILEVAERLFAEHGFEAVSMRDIADAAGVSVALLTYHFATKDNLYRTLFERRQSVIDERLERLHAVNLSARNALEQVVAAFVEPQMQLRETADGLQFARLVAREAADPSSEGRGLIEEFYDPMAREFVDVLQKVLPDVPPDRLRWGYLLAVGAMSMSVLDQRVARFGGDPELPLADKTELLKDFIRAGLTGPPARRTARARRA